MNTNKSTQLGDFLGLFNFAQPQQPSAMPAVYAQQMPPGQVASAAPPQGMVQLSAAPQPQQLSPPLAAQPLPAPNIQYAPQPQQPYQAPVAAVNYGQPVAPTPLPNTAGIDDLMRQNEAYRLQLAHQQQLADQQAAAAKQAELQAMKPMERVEARIQLLQQQSDMATERANEWRIDSARKEIELRHNGRINTNHLDTSSMEALQASVPRALASYADLENEIAMRLRREIGMNTALTVEGLPPAPGVVGMPLSNRGGAVPQGPNSAGYQPGEHPMMQNTWGQYTPNAAHGRVYQPQGPMPSPMPAAGGQMFPPQYQQPAYQQQYQQYQQPQPGYASPPVQLVPQSQMGMPPGMPGAPQASVEMAKATARASILAARKGGSAALAAQGLREPSSQTQALSMQGGAPNPNAMPDPTAFAGQGMHPMHLASGGM